MSFARETSVKAIRKPKRCDGCGHAVEVGQPATRWAGMTDNEFGTALYHPECRAAEVALNRMHDLWGDEWIRLEDIDPEDAAWLRADHPIVAARFGLAETVSG